MFARMRKENYLVILHLNVWPWTKSENVDEFFRKEFLGEKKNFEKNNNFEAILTAQQMDPKLKIYTTTTTSEHVMMDAFRFISIMYEMMKAIHSSILFI